jgi:hypothetical protein
MIHYYALTTCPRNGGASENELRVLRSSSLNPSNYGMAIPHLRDMLHLSQGEK